MTKKSYSYDRFFVSNRKFTTENVKIIKIPDFSRFFDQNSRFSRLFLPKL